MQQIPMSNVNDPFEHESIRKKNIGALYQKLCRNLAHLVFRHKVYSSFPEPEHNRICSASDLKHVLVLLKWYSIADLTVECGHKARLLNVLFRLFISL